MSWQYENQGNEGEGNTHSNKEVLDNIGAVGTTLTYKGVAQGGGGGSVVSDTSGFFFQRENLHVMGTEVEGIINTSTGALQASSTYKASDWIPVEPGVTYTSNFVKTLAVYDKDKMFLSALNTTASDTTSFEAVRPFVIPTNGRYVRYTRGSNIPLASFVRGSVLPHEYLAPGIQQLWISRASFVDSLKLLLGPLYGKKWGCLGDSVTNAGYPDKDTGTVIGYHQVIASQYGVKVTNYGIGGTRITATADGQGFCQRYTAMADDLDYITVMGIINDYANSAGTPIGQFNSTDTSTVYGGMKALCEGLLKKYPTQKLGFIIPFPFNEYKGSGTFKPFYDAMVEVLNYYSIPFLDLYKESRLNANIDFINTAYFKDADKTHPNSKGHAILASKIYSFLLRL